MSRRAYARGPLILLAVFGLCLVVAGCGGDSEVDDSSASNPGGVIVSGGDDGPYAGAEPAQPYQMPDVTLTDDQRRGLQPAAGHRLPGDARSSTATRTARTSAPW